jgi:hypothetical protein
MPHPTSTLSQPTLTSFGHDNPPVCLEPSAYVRVVVTTLTEDAGKEKGDSLFETVVRKA